MRSTPWILTLLLVAGCASEEAPAPLVGNADWSVYLGDNGRQHYSPLDQITRDNVGQLRLAWSYTSGEPRGPGGTMYTSPLVIGGVLYALSPKLVPFALDAATGEEIWRNDLGLDGGAQRGLMYWESAGEKRIFFSQNDELFALSAKDGSLIVGFGTEGKLNMRPPGIQRRSLAVTVPGVVFEDKIIMGFSTTEDADAYPGSIRAFSAVDASLVWQFDTIPKLGDPGSETWAKGSLERRPGGANVWTGMTLDEGRGMLFAPTGSATPDFYGANRLGDNLYANCIVALDARTGELKWHYQNLRHDLWDRDNPSPPTLVQLERDGRTIDAVTLTTKSGHLFVFDRDTGESLYDIDEVETPIPSTLPGEVPATSQPVSTVAISRQEFEITNRSEEATAFVRDQIDGWDLRPWAPPQVGTLVFYPWYDGGAQWGGSAFDPSNNRLILNSQDVAGILELSEVPAGSSDYGTYAQLCGTCHGLLLEGTDQGEPLLDIFDRLKREEVIELIRAGRGRMPGNPTIDDGQMRAVMRFMDSDDPQPDEPTGEVEYVLGGYVYLKDHEGLPGNTPPWGTLNSIDLATGEFDWRVNFGNFPSHPDLGLGAVNCGGPVVTKSGLIFIAATPDAKLRAIDTRDGETLWETDLTAAGFSTPAVYAVDGKQYVVIAAGGGRGGGRMTGVHSGADYMAFSLPGS